MICSCLVKEMAMDGEKKSCTDDGGEQILRLNEQMATEKQMAHNQASSLLCCCIHYVSLCS